MAIPNGSLVLDFHQILSTPLLYHRVGTSSSRYDIILAARNGWWSAHCVERSNETTGCKWWGSLVFNICYFRGQHQWDQNITTKSWCTHDRMHQYWFGLEEPEAYLFCALHQPLEPADRYGIWTSSNSRPTTTVIQVTSQLWPSLQTVHYVQLVAKTV